MLPKVTDKRFSDRKDPEDIRFMLIDDLFYTSLLSGSHQVITCVINHYIDPLEISNSRFGYLFYLRVVDVSKL